MSGIHLFIPDIYQLHQLFEESLTFTLKKSNIFFRIELGLFKIKYTYLEIDSGLFELKKRQRSDKLNMGVREK